MRPLPYRASPNRDARPAGCPVDLLVVHAISLPPGEYGGPWIDALFRNRLPAGHHPYFAEIHTLRVSAHLLVDRAGRATQYVPLHERAWHAGVSRFGDRERCNDFSIGIELEGLPGRSFTSAQYATLAALVAAVRGAFPGITPERIVGHSDIAPGRKEDPGPRFDWARLRRLAGLDRGTPPHTPG
ncbi:MAG: 1,6-anhydro-N-acetylmuramyl-L-alanine amidase AmpD [Gammaproteobacteria bacterium]|nr:1,6-anhydro-N-acetylmuramyl-L-alanine amidase AmpD [Gammaproteobacteria bacterium]